MDVLNLPSLSQVIMTFRIVTCKGSFRRVFLIEIARFSQFFARPFGALFIYGQEFYFSSWGTVD